VAADVIGELYKLHPLLLTTPGNHVHSIHMKRTNLVLDEDKLEKATRLMGAKTYSEAVNRALDEAIKLMNIRAFAGLMGHDVWSGSISEMREDRPARRRRRKTR